MSSTILIASTQRTIGWILTIIVMVGFLVYLLFSFRIGKRELGSEVELAANRKPYFDDDGLETFRLDRALLWSLVTLTAVSMILPLYWLMEPARQENAIVDWVNRFEKRGGRNFEEACSSCHGPGGVGGVAAFTLVDAEGGFVAQVEWKAPALTTVLSRFDESEVRHILNYGRPGTPMPAWGLPGGGPMTTQQVHQLVVYLRSIQLDQDAIFAQIDSGIAAGARSIVVAADSELTDPADIAAAVEAWVAQASDPASSDYLRYGELIFNNPAAQGANACARCHTPGFSYGAADEASTAELIETWPKLVESGILTGWQPAQGHVGPSLEGVASHFPTLSRQVDFVYTGSEVGVGFGNARSGTGMMPGFGGRVDADVIDYDTDADAVYSRILTYEQITAVVAYERSR
jgi:mono/diheme cytochrome c family protein